MGAPAMVNPRARLRTAAEIRFEVGFIAFLNSKSGVKSEHYTSKKETSDRVFLLILMINEDGTRKFAYLHIRST